jgi:hypothetical protein
MTQAHVCVVCVESGRVLLLVNRPDPMTQGPVCVVCVKLGLFVVYVCVVCVVHVAVLGEE